MSLEKGSRKEQMRHDSVVGWWGQQGGRRPAPWRGKNPTFTKGLNKNVRNISDVPLKLPFATGRATVEAKAEVEVDVKHIYAMALKDAEETNGEQSRGQSRGIDIEDDVTSTNES